MQRGETQLSSNNAFTPFFVADRQASLRILAGLNIPNGKRMGIMTHANTYKPFKTAFKNFPCIEPQSCPVIGGKPCPYSQNLLQCQKGRIISEGTIKISDSGVFQKEGCKQLSYSDLFDRYEEAGVDYGIIMDFLKDKDKTLDTAKNALIIHNKENRNFRLIGVAQGETLEDYIECYKGLKKMGYQYIAIGGMLQRRINSARYVLVKNENLLRQILTAIREIDKNGWLFALGCYSPRRHAIFLETSISGADYKGWIFQYETKSPQRGNERAQMRRFNQVRKFVEKDILDKSQTWRDGSKLLIVQCSERKINYGQSRRAITVYDGPMFRMLRKRVNNFSNNDGLDILILSAKYGIIEPSKNISYYDMKMTSDRAIQLQNDSTNILKKVLQDKKFHSVMVNVSPNYFEAIAPGLESTLGDDFIKVEGRIGERLKTTKDWLNL